MVIRTGLLFHKRCKKITKYNIVVENNVDKDGSIILIQMLIKTNGLMKKRRKFS
jgi:hypothetical protein